MNRLGIVLAALTIISPVCYGQASTPAPAQGTNATIGHGAFPVTVIKTLDSSKLKQDDTVEVETAGSFKLPDGTLVPKGSKLEGRVVEAKARAKGDSTSELILAFHKLNIAGGKELSVNGSVQAVFPPAEEPAGPNMSTMGTSAGGSVHGSTVGGGGVNPGGVGLTDSKNGADTQSSSSPQLVMDTKAVGVQGVHDLQLEDGTLTSKGKTVKLGGRIRMIVKVDILG